jgi:hypothetical protein
MKLAIALLFCVGLRADFDVTFSTGSASAVLVKGQGFGEDTISFVPESGFAQDGDTLALPLLDYFAGCYRTDPGCPTTSFYFPPVTITAPVTLTNSLGQALTEMLSYTVTGDFITGNVSDGQRFLASHPGPAIQFAFGDGETWTVTETESLNGTFHDFDSVRFGALSFVATPEPSALAEVGLVLLLIAIAGRVRRTGKSSATIAVKLPD